MYIAASLPYVTSWEEKLCFVPLLTNECVPGLEAGPINDLLCLIPDVRELVLRLPHVLAPVPMPDQYQPVEILGLR